MKTLQATLLFLFMAASLPALADTLYNFTTTGQGVTLQFSSGNPPTVVEYPGGTEVFADDPAGSVNGVGGYSVYASFVAYGFYHPNFTINVSPLPPGFRPFSPLEPPEFSLSGPDVLTLVSDQPNPTPCSIPGFCPNDLLTFNFAPGMYSFAGIGPTLMYGDFNLDITEDAPATITPEPQSWVLLLTGAAGLAFGVRRRYALR